MGEPEPGRIFLRVQLRGGPGRSQRKLGGRFVIVRAGIFCGYLFQNLSGGGPGAYPGVRDGFWRSAGLLSRGTDSAKTQLSVQPDPGGL